MRILTALDRSEYSEIVLEHGLDQAVRHPNAALHFATAIPDKGEVDLVRSALDATIRERLVDFGLQGRAFEVHVVTGRPAPAICALAHELQADLLVIGRFHVPSEAETMLWLSPCPTLVVGPDGPEVEPQCTRCAEIRRETAGERLFCDAHAGAWVPDLITRLPPVDVGASRIWWP